MLVPEFCLTKEEAIKLKNMDSGYIKEAMSKWTTYPVRYLNVRDHVFDQFINEKKTETYSTKAVSLIFTLMKQATTTSDYISLSSSIIALYQINKAHSERLLSLLRSKVSSTYLTT